jgi:deoxyribodipyrimidine photolyase
LLKNDDFWFKNIKFLIGYPKNLSPYETQKSNFDFFQSIRPFFRPLPKYKALGEPDNYDAMEDELEEPGPSTIIKEEPLSDKEDEEEKSTRQQEVKVLKKGSKKEKQAFEVNIKEEPIDFDERVDEPFIVQPSGRTDLDLARIVSAL